MPKNKPPRGTKARAGKSNLGKRRSAAIVRLATKRGSGPKGRDATNSSKLDLSVDVEYLLPKLDNE